MTLYKKKYRIETTRKPGHDYASPGYYFVTICTKKRLQWFGEIHHATMKLSELGKDVEQCLCAIPIHFPHAKIDAFCIMPNHVHIILEIKSTKIAIQHPFVETQNFASLQKSLEGNKGNIFGPQSKNLGSIVRGFKIGVTKIATVKKLPFEWQSRYHDHIVRSKEELSVLRRYIDNNAVKWDKETIPWHADAASWFPAL